MVNQNTFFITPDCMAWVIMYCKYWACSCGSIGTLSWIVGEVAQPTSVTQIGLLAKPYWDAIVCMVCHHSLNDGTSPYDKDGSLFPL